MTNIEAVMITVSICILITFSFVVGFDHGRFNERGRHRKYCACKDCQEWQEVRQGSSPKHADGCGHFESGHCTCGAVDYLATFGKEAK